MAVDLVTAFLPRDSGSPTTALQRERTRVSDTVFVARILALTAFKGACIGVVHLLRPRRTP
jgi:hypothetical protein